MEILGPILYLYSLLFHELDSQEYILIYIILLILNFLYLPLIRNYYYNLMKSILVTPSFIRDDSNILLYILSSGIIVLDPNSGITT